MQHTDTEWHLYWSAVARKHEERKEKMENEQLEFDFVNNGTLPSGTETSDKCSESDTDAPSGKDTRIGSKPTPPAGYEIIPLDEYAECRNDETVLIHFGGGPGWAERCYGTPLDEESWYCRPVKGDESDRSQEATDHVSFSNQELADMFNGNGFASVSLSEFLLASKSEFEIAAEQIGRLVTEKNRAYGNSFVDSAKILTVLYPDGIPLHAYEDAGVIIRVCDKLKRIATDNDPFGEDPWEDIAGYGIIAHVRRTHKRREATVLARREDEHSGTDDCSD